MQDALAKQNYDAAYQIAFATVTREPDVSDREARAESFVGFLLLGGLEYLAFYDKRSSTWYRPELMASLPYEERVRVGMTWMRRAAYRGFDIALHQMHDAYQGGWTNFPRDLELSDCFEAAISDAGKLETCKQLEIARGYVTERTTEEPALPPVHP